MVRIGQFPSSAVATLHKRLQRSLTGTFARGALHPTINILPCAVTSRTKEKLLCFFKIYFIALHMERLKRKTYKPYNGSSSLDRIERNDDVVEQNGSLFGEVEIIDTSLANDMLAQSENPSITVDMCHLIYVQVHLFRW